MSQERLSTSTKPPRLSSVDVVKGIAIILMVFGHTEQGAMHRQWWDTMPYFVRGIQFGDDFIYSFHMPAFFFISGLFLAHSLQRRGPVGFTLEKVRTILYPYILWGLISDVSMQITAQFRSSVHAFTWHGLVSDLLSGDDGWFLISLFVCQLLALAVIRLPHWFQMALALAGCFFIPNAGVLVLYQPFLYFPFVVAGIWIGGRLMFRVEDLSRSRAWMAFAVLLAIQSAIIALWGPRTRRSMVPLGLSGILMLFVLSRGIRGTAGDRALRWFGEASLAILLLSAFCQGTVREILLRVFHTTAPLPQLLLPILFATIIPALIWHFQDMLHVGWVFHWPFPTRQGSLTKVS